MTFYYRWQVAVLMMAIGLTSQSTILGEELCPHCAQKGGYSHAQKLGFEGKGYVGGKGAYQKGYAQKGYAHKSHTPHKKKEHKWFFSEHPPAAPIFSTTAVRRVPVPQQVNFRIEQESGDLRPAPESGAAPRPEAGAPPSDDIERRLGVLEEHVKRLYSSLDQLVDQLQNVDKVGQ